MKEAAGTLDRAKEAAGALDRKRKSRIMETNLAEATEKERLKPGGFFWEGLLAAAPICIGSFPIGLAFGVLAQKAGLGLVDIALMSILVFAGSSQFIAVSMLSAGAAFVPIVVMTFMVNLRHLLMSSSLAVMMSRAKLSFPKLSLFAYGITDETFAVNITKFKEVNWDYKRGLIVNFAMNLSWLASTVLGGVGGQFIPADAFGIDYALNAMFIGLLMYQLKGNIYAVTAVFAGVSAVVLSLVLPGNGYIIIASILAATAGVIIKRKKQTVKSV